MKHIVQFLPSLSLALVLAAPMGSVFAAGDQNEVDAQYQKDREACMAKQGSGESREACLREAGAVRQANHQGALSGATTASALQRNALARCEVHQDEVARSACQRMAQGEGASQGSVEKGGIFRETITVIPSTLQTGTEPVPAPKK